MKIQVLLALLVLFPGFQSNGTLEEAIRLYGRGEYKQATKLFLQASSSSPDEADKRLWLAKSYLKVHDWNSAIREMEAAVQLAPTHALYHLWLGRACGMRASHSFPITAIRWALRVVKEFETARKLSPENLDVRFDLLSYYLDAWSSLGGGKDKAEAEVKAISKLDPKKGHTARAIVFEKNKQWDLARKELTLATEEYPNYSNAYKDLAYFLLNRNDFKEALKNAQKALALDGESKPARLIVAASETRLRIDLPEAEKTLQELAAATMADEDPAFEEVYYWLGECYLAQGNKDKAREAFQSALAFNPYYDRAKNSISDLR